MATIETTMYAAPGHDESPVELKPRYENFIGGHWIAPIAGAVLENISPVTGEPFTEVPRSTRRRHRARARRRLRREGCVGRDVDAPSARRS